jgi:predicted dehydrogenase
VKYKVLLVGLGQIGLGYDLALNEADCIHTHARAFQNHSNFDLIAGVDLNVRNRYNFELHYKKPTFRYIKEALDYEKYDVIVISTPTDTHSKILFEIVSRSAPRVILCEKPLSYSLNEAEKMVAICEKSGIRLLVNYIRRSEPALIAIKERIDSQIIEPPFKGVVYYNKGFLHNASHFFELLRHWFGPMKGYQVCSKNIQSSLDEEIDAFISFGDQAQIYFLNFQDHKLNFWRLEIFASNGKLTYSSEQESVVWMKKKYNLLQNVVELAAPELILGHGLRYQLNVVNQLDNFLNQKDFYLCSGSEALETLIDMKKLIRKF